MANTTNIEYLVIRKVTNTKTGETVYEPYEVLASSPLEAVETVAAELLPTQDEKNEYIYGANTLRSVSWYAPKTQVVIHMEKLSPIRATNRKVGEAE